METYNANRKAAITALNNHLEKNARTEPGWGFATTLLANGRFWNSTQPLQHDTRGIAKLCFANSQSTILTSNKNDRKLSYVEGLAYDFDLEIPLHHAWLVDQNGNVLDPTWTDADNCLYYGPAFRDEYVLERINARGEAFDSLLIDLCDRHRLLRDRTRWQVAFQ